MQHWRATRVRLVLTSVAFAFVVGLVALLESMLTPGAGPLLPVVWWTAYALFVADLLAVQGYLPHPRWLPADALLAFLAVLGAALVLLFPSQGWMALLFVMTATMASFFWSARAVTVLIGVQTLLVVVTALVGAWPTIDLLVGATVFGVSQVFGALVVFTARSEAAARRDLAVAHAELSSTAALLRMTTQEAERLRIARDLHDLTGHHLTALSLELEIASHLATADAVAENLERARAITKELLGTVRTAVGQMRTEPVSLATALRELAAGIPSLDISVEITGTPRLKVEQAVTILRCVQEAITNTKRHTEAQAARIRIDDDTHDIQVIVADDGEGTARIVPGHGLTGMRERIELLGGTLELHSAPGAGFTVTAHLPHDS